MSTDTGNQNATATAKAKPENTSETRGTPDRKTLDSLFTAMHGEAFAYCILYS